MTSRKLTEADARVSRRDMLRYGVSLAAVSGFTSKGISALAQIEKSPGEILSSPDCRVRSLS